jgi:group I intron endonuclease
MIIYKHTCKANGKPYIGQSVKTMEARWAEHCTDARYNKKRKFFAAMNKYGFDNWTHEVLFEPDDPELISDKETEYIKLFDSVKNGYNSTYDRFRTNTLHSQESIEKMRVAQKAKHARRREQNNGEEIHKEHKPHRSGWEHPRKGKNNPNCGPEKGTLGWKKINGTRVWFKK